MHCHVLSDHPLVYTLLNSNRVWVHKWLLSGEQHGLLRLKERWRSRSALIDNTRGAVSSRVWPPINKLNQCHFNSADSGATGWSFYSWKNIVKDINHCVKVCLISETRINNPLFKMSLCIIACLCLFWFRIYSRWGKAFFASEVKQVCSNGGWGILWTRRQPNPKGRGHTTHQPANIPQRRQLVRNSFCLSLSHFPCHWVTFMNLNRQPSIPFMPPFSLCVCILSLFPGARVNGSCSNGIVGLYLSTSIATTAAVKGNRTEVTGTTLCLLLYTLPLSCCQFYSSSWPISLSSSAFY